MPVAARNPSISGSSSGSCARAWSISPTCTPGPIQRRPDVSGISPSSARSNVVLPLPFGPRIAIRSCQPISRSIGPERRSVPRCTTACSSRTTTSPLRADGASCSRSSQPSHGFSTTSSRSIARSVIFAFAACFSLRSVLAWRMFLSGSPLFLTLRLPCSDHAFCVRDRSSSADRLARNSS